MKKALISCIITMLLLPISYVNTSSFQSRDLAVNGEDKITPQSGQLERISDVESIGSDFQSGVAQHLNSFFTANYGQVGSDEVKYYIQGQGVWFTSNGVVMQIVGKGESERGTEYIDPLFETDINLYHSPFTIHPSMNQMKHLKRTVIQFNFLNSNSITPIGFDRLPHKSNFFYGNDSSQWCTNVPNYASIVYENIYDNIDLKYYFNEKGVKRRTDTTGHRSLRSL